MEDSGSEPLELSPVQSRILEGFVDHYTEVSNVDSRFTSYYDQASAYLRDTLVEKFGLKLEKPEDYYVIMEGLSVGIVWVEGLVANGLSLHDAAEVMRTSLARLYPQEPTSSTP